MLTAYTNCSIFTGEKTLQEHVVLVDEGEVVEVLPMVQVPEDLHTIDCGGYLLAPSFIDLQIYGAKGKLLSAYPTAGSLDLLAGHNAESGTSACLATIATQPMQTILESIEAIKAYWQQGGTGIMGMHLEGPFINADKRGAHVKEWIHAPSVEAVEELLRQADGVIKMVTLAPEIVDEKIIDVFTQNNIVVSIGHSSASFAQATKAMDRGASTVTHLFNAMGPLHHREPGIVGAAMRHATATASIIPDGIHVDYEAVKIAKQVMGERLFFITDAVTGTGIGPYQHVLDKDHFDLPNGTLSGSALTMLQAIRNAVQHCDIPPEEALRMASLYPARVMGMDDRWGKIQKGYIESFCLIDGGTLSLKALFGQ